MKITLTLIIGILTTTSLFSQSQPVTFAIGDYINVMENDSILIYYNCTGTIVDKRCAEFFRIGKTDSVHINISGKFHDYYMNGKIALEAIMENDYLNGEATYYYENGIITSNGKYKQDKKVGVWTYYYENGVKDKVINYVNDYPFIVEYFNRNDKQKVIAGNGNYKGKFNSYKSCIPFSIWGQVNNGKMEGEWTLYNSYFHQKLGNEFFENGQFIEGKSGTYTYNDYQKILINGFCANENLHLEDNCLGCPGDSGVFYPEYKRNSLIASYYPKLIDTLTTVLNQRLLNQWLIIGLKITKDSELKTINIKSSIDDHNIESVVYDILESMKDFTAAKANGDFVDFDLFFTILIRNNQIIIPIEYIYRNL